MLESKTVFHFYLQIEESILLSIELNYNLSNTDIFTTLQENISRLTR